MSSVIAGWMKSVVRHLRRPLIVALVCVQIALLAFGLRHVPAGLSDPAKSFTSLQTGLPSGIPLTIEDGAAVALGRAQQWSGDATLFAVSMQIDWPTEMPQAGSADIPTGGWVIYTFGSSKPGDLPGSQGSTLSLMVDRQSGIVLDEREIGWSETPARHLDFSGLPISSTVALFAGELTAGTSYRTTCPKYRNLSRLALVPGSQTAHPTWVVTYEDDRLGGQPAITIQIDAQTGDVQQQSGAVANELPCT